MFDIFARDDQLTIGKVSLKGAADGLRARLRFEAALAGLSLSSLKLPPKSLLMVNRLAPTARLRLDRLGVVENFGQVVRMALERNAGNASRPWVNPETTNAEAVLFSDESELMACLLRDWLQGSLAGRWWWPVVLDGLPVQAWWRRKLLPHGDALPAVLAHLAAQRQAIAWMEHLSESETTQAIAAIVAAHAMNSLTVWLNAAPLLPEAAPPISQDPQARTHSPAPPSDSLQDSLVACRHLVAVVPESKAPALTISQRRLLVLALGLQRASSWTRSPAFVIALQAMESVGVDEDSIATAHDACGLDRWMARPSHSDMTDSMVTASKKTIDKPKPVIHSFEQLHESLNDQRKSWGDNAEGLGTNGSVSIPSTADLSPPPVGSSILPETGMPVASLVSLPKHDEELIPAFQRGVQAEDLPAHSSLSPEFTPYSDSDPAIQFQHTIETRYGGIFYLLNVALALGLYGDFTQPREPGITLSPWDWLALVGRAWFGWKFEQDALWRLLAELAGRSDKDVPGCDFLPSDVWRVPDEWIKPWGTPKSIKVYATQKRIQIWHEAGFVLIDAARIANIAPLVQAIRLCAQSTVLGNARLVRITKPLQPSQPIAGDPALNRWLRWVLLYLHARLQRSLGDDAPERLVGLVCCHAAQINCTATAIDVHFALAALPIAVRIAGLDRDPGWIPASGRSIAFHFE